MWTFSNFAFNPLFEKILGSYSDAYSEILLETEYDDILRTWPQQIPFSIDNTNPPTLFMSTDETGTIVPNLFTRENRTVDEKNPVGNGYHKENNDKLGGGSTVCVYLNKLFIPTMQAQVNSSGQIVGISGSARGFEPNIRVTCTFSPPYQKRPLYYHHYMTQIKENPEGLDHVLKHIQHDFKDKLRRQYLANEDERLFLDSSVYGQCQFCRHMQFKTLFKYVAPRADSKNPKEVERYKRFMRTLGRVPEALSKDDKHQIFHNIKQLWSSAQATLILPVAVLENMEKVAIEKQQRFNEDNFDIKEVADECKKIIKKVTAKHFNQIVKWAKSLIFSKHTPITDLLPDTYYKLGTGIHSILLDDDYREILMETVQPLMSQVKATAEDRGIALTIPEIKENGDSNKAVVESKKQESNGKDDDDDDDEIDFECNTETVPLDQIVSTDASEEDTKTVYYLIDMLFTILEKNTNSLRIIKENPFKVLEVLANPKELQTITKNLQEDVQQAHVKNEIAKFGPMATVMSTTHKSK